nr:hypothetical protein [Polymorphobacter sp.]
MERDNEADGGAALSCDGAMLFETAPSLTFTKPLAASIGGKPVRNPNWASILHAMFAQLKAKGLEGDKLTREISIPTKTGKYEDEGYKYQSKFGISIQGQSAADAWKEVDRLAKKWRIPVTVEFMWRQNPKAQHPGKNGVLKSGVA